ncbi:hypothetical protein [Streptomyces sp. NPDC046197]|uniref:hypothetical protein n=1 Tax=Streptomyces sp. NPDC046197 TaxID=3154337 RepID=UPI0033C207F2
MEIVESLPNILDNKFGSQERAAKLRQRALKQAVFGVARIGQPTEPFGLCLIAHKLMALA